RRPASRRPSSGPWHLKQLFERIGRISRLKSISAAGNCETARVTQTAIVGSANCMAGAVRNGSVGGGYCIRHYSQVFLVLIHAAVRFCPTDNRCVRADHEDFHAAVAAA